MGESSFSVRLQCLQKVANGQREHDTVNSMGDTLWNDNVFFVQRNSGSVYCGNLKDGYRFFK